jgi:signal transduction histidine kinase
LIQSALTEEASIMSRLSLASNPLPNDTITDSLPADLLKAGNEFYEHADLAKALELLKTAIAQAELKQDWHVQAEALVAEGKVYRDLGEPSQALACLDEALEIARDNAATVIEGTALNQRAGVNHNLGEYALALKDLTLSLELARQRGDDRRIANTLINMGILSTKLADYPRALVMLNEAHKQITKLNDPILEGECFSNLGLLYEYMGDDAKALETYQLAFQTVAGLGNRALEAFTTLNLGDVHKRLEHFDAATQRFEEALTLARDIKLSNVELAALIGLGQIHTSLGYTEAALRLHQEALKRSQETGDAESEIEAFLNLGRDQLALKQPRQAVERLLTALDLSKRAEHKKFVIESHGLLSEAFEKLGNLQKALEHFRTFHALEKALFNEEREKKTRQLSIQFDLERARYEAEVYRIRTEIEREAKERAEATVQERTLELVESNQTIEQQRQALQEQVIKLHQLLEQNEALRQHLVLAARRNTTLNERSLRRLSAELHDGPAQDLGFALIKLESGEIDATANKLPAEQREKYSKELETIHSSIARALNEMRSIAGGMCLPELSHVSLPETIQRAVRSHQRRTQTDVTVDVATQLENVPLPVKITLYRLVQESLMNAFKHSGGKGQAVHLFAKDDQLHLEVKDQGPGFVLSDSLEHNNRLGLVGMRERVESLGGSFWIDTKLGQGTTVHAVLSLQGSSEIAI